MADIPGCVNGQCVINMETVLVELDRVKGLVQLKKWILYYMEREKKIFFSHKLSPYCYCR